ncbi:MAG: redoxin domain-containing protein [Planctomycetes bacterium]|nr:redoxin domain-containing protein [Planctomycetota bacterium]
MKTSKLSLVALVAAAGIILPAVAMSSPDQPSDKPAATAPSDSKKNDKKQDNKATESAAKVGSVAPPFTLTDTDGKQVNLSDFTGKIVVIQWFNPGCPFVKKHYENGANTFNDLNKKYSDKGVVFIAINSGAAGKEGAGKDANASAKKDWKIDYSILLDESGKVGKLYGATRTPEMFIVNKDGTIAYHGAIDDDPSKNVGKTNYVAKALDEILAGKPVTTSQTKPYGCTVKYGS